MMKRVYMDNRYYMFQHTADHALHAVELCDVADLQSGPDAAGFHQLDVDEVGRAGLAISWFTIRSLLSSIFP